MVAHRLARAVILDQPNTQTSFSLGKLWLGTLLVRDPTRHSYSKIFEIEIFGAFRLLSASNAFLIVAERIVHTTT